MSTNSTPYSKDTTCLELAEDLVNSGLLAATDIKKINALDTSQSKHKNTHPLEFIASLKLARPFNAGLLNEDILFRWLAQRTNMTFHAFDPLQFDVEAITAVMSYVYAKRHGILAVKVTENELFIASSLPWRTNWIDNLYHVHRKNIQHVIARPTEIKQYTKNAYSLMRSVGGALKKKKSMIDNVNNFEQLLTMQLSSDLNDNHIINIVDWLLQFAFEQRASDIHIEPKSDCCALRLRIDGILHLIYKMPVTVASAVKSRLKILGRMNVAEKRKPQDGRLKTQSPSGAETELRLSTIPTAFGEKIVLRIFDQTTTLNTLTTLGLSDAHHQSWQNLINNNQGIVLVTGPTGSGKTTTLYSTLRTLAKETVNICTIEDPIEMIIPSFNQMQVQNQIDLNFSTGLRALLRQDPDIIMIGEIRDAETAHMSIQAALTGHFVLSTMHTHDAPSAIIRMLELGIPAYLIKSCLLGVMAQRLVRTLCPFCKIPQLWNECTNQDWQAFIQGNDISKPSQLFMAKGCVKCRDTGYLGRTGIYELMTINESLQKIINDKNEQTTLRKKAIKNGMETLGLSGIKKVIEGVTTIEEILRVLPKK